MSTQEINDLARQLTPEARAILRQGMVSAVDTATNTISVKWGNASTASPRQKYLSSYAPVVGDAVWGVRDGDDVVVMGTLGPTASMPDTSSFVHVLTNASAVVPSAVSTRLTGFAVSQGNAALWDAANQWYTVPRDGLYTINARLRIADSQTLGLNIGMGIDTSDAPAETMMIWDAIPTNGAFRRKTMIFNATQRFGAGQQLRMTTYMDGAAVTVTTRSMSFLRLGN